MLNAFGVEQTAYNEICILKRGYYIMKQNFILLLAVLIVSAAFAGNTTTVTPKSAKPMGTLRDGFGLPNSGVEGLVIKAKGKEKWVFAPFEDITDGRVRVLKGWAIELLPSSTLGKIVGMMNEGGKRTTTMEVKLWGKVSRYSNVTSTKRLYAGKDIQEDEVYTRNYIFPMNFIPITTIKDITGKKPAKDITAAPEDPNSIIPQEAKDIIKPANKKTDEPKKKTDSILPEDVMNKFKLERVENLAKWKKNTKIKKDASLINRSGFITQGEKYKIFSIDAMGRKVNDTKIKLLPCETLQRTERDIVTSPGRNRYQVSGTITIFNGELYMLLQRSVKTYNHGNFAR